MKIHLKQIPAGGLHLEGEEDCPIVDVADQEVSCAGPLKYVLDVGLSADALWANGTLQQPIESRCVSCLEKFVHTVEIDGFAMHTELGGPETIDLTPFMREDILLNLPPYPHCDRHGGRVCSAASTQLREPDSEPKARPDWGPLDKLKL